MRGFPGSHMLLPISGCSANRNLFKTFVTSKSARVEQNFGHKYAVAQVDQLLLRHKLHVQIE